VKQLEGIDLPNMVMMHDFNITQNHVIFMDLPLALDLDLLASGVPFSFQKDKGARLGVMPRTGTNKDIRWFEIDPCYVFHPVNAFEKDNIITLYVSRQGSAFGADSEDYSEVGRLHRWQINLENGTVSQDGVDDRAADFGRVNDAYVGLENKFGYLMSLDGEGNSEEPIYGAKLYKYDLPRGQCEEHYLGDNVRGAEPVFAPAAATKAEHAQLSEDEGWILTLAHDENSSRSRLVIINAQNFSAPPVATVELPFRVPYGAHGNWIADSALN
jgi:carotenoid cleavage dioxygenase